MIFGDASVEVQKFSIFLPGTGRAGARKSLGSSFAKLGTLLLAQLRWHNGHLVLRVGSHSWLCGFREVLPGVKREMCLKKLAPHLPQAGFIGHPLRHQYTVPCLYFTCMYIMVFGRPAMLGNRTHRLVESLHFRHFCFMW